MTCPFNFLPYCYQSERSRLTIGHQTMTISSDYLCEHFKRSSLTFGHMDSEHYDCRLLS